MTTAQRGYNSGPVGSATSDTSSARLSIEEWWNTRNARELRCHRPFRRSACWFVLERCSASVCRRDSAISRRHDRRRSWRRSYFNNSAVRYLRAAWVVGQSWRDESKQPKQTNNKEPQPTRVHLGGSTTEVTRAQPSSSLVAEAVLCICGGFGLRRTNFLGLWMKTGGRLLTGRALASHKQKER